MKKFMLLALVGIIVIVTAVQGKWYRIHKSIVWFGYGTDSVQLKVVTTGDTAEVVYITPTSEMDSFEYRDSLLYNADLANWDTVSWVSPLQAMILTMDTTTVGMDSIVYADTFVLDGGELISTWTSPEYTVAITPSAGTDDEQYICSVFLAVDTFIATWTAPATGTSVAMVCDSMVDSINNTADLSDSCYAEDSTTYYIVRYLFGSGTFGTRFTTATDVLQDGGAVSVAATNAMLVDSIVHSINNTTTLKDTLVAQDSVTYIRVLSKFGTEQLAARWSMKFDSDFMDTVSQITTAAMVCDSMVARINSDDSMGIHVTATDSTTAYYIVGDDPGLDIQMICADSASDTVYAQLNVTSRSITKDTLDLSRHFGGPSPIISAMYARFILEASATTSQGLGNSDSGYLWLYTVLEGADGTDELHLLDSSLSAALPCTLRVGIGRDTTGGGVDPDTLFKENLVLMYMISDTASDSTFTANYTIDVDLKALQEE